MSGGQSGYELSEAKAILTELKSIRKAISSGEKEKQDLMQVGDGGVLSQTTAFGGRRAPGGRFLRQPRTPFALPQPLLPRSYPPALTRLGGKQMRSQVPVCLPEGPRGVAFEAVGGRSLSPHKKISILVPPAAHRKLQAGP